MAATTGAIDLLELEGPTLGRPIVDTVHGSKFHIMKELRNRHPDPVHLRSSAAGNLATRRDKAASWNSWYDKNIPVTEQRYRDWLTTAPGGD